jgi:hypothetical protein
VGRWRFDCVDSTRGFAVRDYHLHELSGDEHEQLVVRICRDILGMGTMNFSEGKDRGKDGKFTGTAQKYPSENSPWSGIFIIQSKRVNDPTKSCSDPDFKTKVLKKEIPKIAKLRAAGECDAYMVFTNRKLSAGTEEDLVKFIKTGTGVANAAVLGVEIISSWLDGHPKVVTACGLNTFQGPLRIHPAELRDLITGFHSHWDSILNDAAAKYELDYVQLDTKNQLNSLSQPYFDYIQENSASFFQTIDDFLKNPINNDMLEYYYTIVDELKSKIIAKRSSFENFDEIFPFIYDQVLEDMPELTGHKRRLVNVFLHYMYCKCDIGRKK